MLAESMIENEDGAVGFLRLVRGYNGGEYVLQVNLPGRNPLFVHYDAVPQEDRKGFSIEVLSGGMVHAEDAGIPNVYRRALESSEIDKMQRLVKFVLLDQQAEMLRKNVFIFKFKNYFFNGEINFADGWALRESGEKE